MSQGRYVVGLDTLNGSVLGKGNSYREGEWTFPLTLKEARTKIAEHHPLPQDPEFVMFRLVKVKKAKKTKER